MQRPPILAPRQGRVRRLGPRPGTFLIHPDDGVQLRIILFNPAQEMIQQLDGADLAVPDLGGQFGGGGEMQL